MQQTVVEIKGQDRLESVVVAEVDDNFKPIKGTEYEIECDTLLLSVGLIPENELSEEAGVEMSSITGGPIVNEGRETNIEGIFACGNVLHVHDLVDWVTEESLIAGKTAADYLKGGIAKRSKAIDVNPGENVGYIVPHKITNKVDDRKLVNLYMRAKQPMADVKINLYAGDKKLLDKKARRVEPGEMITFPVPEKMFSSNDISSLKVDIVKEEK
jgi:hypothetical protein